SDALRSGAERPPTLPDWAILPPEPLDALVGYYQEAQARYGVPWTYLAAIHFIETRFGRIRGPSSAGALGPMQFLPGTWDIYGEGGDIYANRDAILAAARLLRADGAPDDIDGAVFHFNPDAGYVAAVRIYASGMARDPRELYGYFEWQVIYGYEGGTVILPIGYPQVGPESLG